MTTQIKTLLKITLSLFLILVILGFYYFFVTKNNDENLVDPLYCTENKECTTYSLLNCSNAKPINQKYKTEVLNIIESKDSLCGEIKTACINNACIIIK